MCERGAWGVLGDDSGASAVIVAILIVALLGVAAIVIDSGMLYSERRSMQTAADAGALAGVQQLPTNPGSAPGHADQYVSANPAGAQASGKTYTVSTTSYSNDTMRVHIWQPAYGLSGLGRFIGIGTEPVGATAAAKVESPGTFSSGLMPFAVMPPDCVPEATVTLKKAAGGGSSGNYGLIDLDGIKNPNQMKSMIAAGGCSSPVSIGAVINTDPGKNGPQVTSGLNSWINSDPDSFSLDQVAPKNPDGTRTIAVKTCHRLIVCPIVVGPGGSTSWDSVNGRKPVTVVGFGFFFITSVGTQGNDCTVTGVFIKPMTPDELTSWRVPFQWGSYDPYGAVGFRLIQ